MSHVDRCGLFQEPPLSFQFHAPHEEIAAVADIGAQGALDDDGGPQADDDRQDGLKSDGMPVGICDHIDKLGGMRALIMPRTLKRMRSRGDASQAMAMAWRRFFLTRLMRLTEMAIGAKW